MDKNTKVLAAAILAGLFLSTLVLSKFGLTVRTLNSGIDQNGRAMNSISTDGTGKVYLKPDMARLNFSFSENAQTTSQALLAVNKKVNQATEILVSQGVDEKDIETTNLSIYPEYDYTSGRAPYRITAQRATISVEVKIKKLDDTATKASNIIDKLSQIENVQIGSLVFDVENKKQYTEEARVQAVADAKSKAESLAMLTGVSVGKPLSVTESQIGSLENYNNRPMYAAKDMAMAEPVAMTDVSSGQIVLEMSVSVIWSLN